MLRKIYSMVIDSIELHRTNLFRKNISVQKSDHNRNSPIPEGHRTANVRQRRVQIGGYFSYAPQIRQWPISNNEPTNINIWIPVLVLRIIFPFYILALRSYFTVQRSTRQMPNDNVPMVRFGLLTSCTDFI